MPKILTIKRLILITRLELVVQVMWKQAYTRFITVIGLQDTSSSPEYKCHEALHVEAQYSGPM